MTNYKQEFMRHLNIKGVKFCDAKAKAAFASFILAKIYRQYRLLSLLMMTEMGK